MQLYVTQFICLATLDHRTVWWRLFHCPYLSNWSNILALAILLFIHCLYLTENRKRLFSSVLKIIKVNRRSSLGSSSLRDTLTANTNVVSMKDFDPDPCIELWWKAKVRRPDQKRWKGYKKQKVTHGNEAELVLSCFLCSPFLSPLSRRWWFAVCTLWL